MPIAKTVPKPQEAQQEIQTQPIGNPPINFEWEGVPIDIYRNFSIEIGTLPKKETRKLKDIYEWAKTKTDEPTMGNILQKINTLERELGSPAIDQKRYDKIWEWIKFSLAIDDLEKRREALRGKKWQAI